MLLYKYDPADRVGTMQSRVMQVVGGAIRYTDLAGSIRSLEYSPSGTYLIVRRLDPVGGETVAATILLDNTGKVLWVKNDYRSFSFSTTGQVLYAWSGGFLRAQPRVEVFALSGVSKGSLETSEAQWFAVPGPGQKVLWGMDRSIIPLAFPGGTESATRVDLAATEEPMVWPDLPLDGTHLLVWQQVGCFLVLNTNGAVEYRYVPEALGASDPTKTREDYARYRPYATSESGKLMLFDGTSTALSLDWVSGEIQPLSVDVAPPEGYRLMLADFRYQRVFFAGATTLRIRSLSQLLPMR